MLHLKLLEKQEQAKVKTSRREIIKIKTKINELVTKKKIQRINEKADSLTKSTRLTSPW
jgi:hypothetical protein